MALSSKSYNGLDDISKKKVEKILRILERYSSNLTTSVSLMDEFVPKLKEKDESSKRISKTEKKKFAVQKVVDYVNNPDSDGRAQSRVVSVETTYLPGESRVLYYANNAFLGLLRSIIRSDKSKDRKSKDEALKLIDEKSLDGLSGLAFVYDYNKGRIGLVSTAEGKNTGSASSLSAHYFYIDKAEDGSEKIKSSAVSNMFSINKTASDGTNMDFLGYFYDQFIAPAIKDLGLKGKTKDPVPPKPVPVPPKPVPKPEFNFATCALPITVIRSIVRGKSESHGYTKNKKEIDKLRVEAGDKKGKLPKDSKALKDDEGKLVEDRNMKILFTPGVNGKVDAWVYRNSNNITEPISKIFGTYGLPPYDPSLTEDENIGKLTREHLEDCPYFAKVQKDFIERRKGKGNELYYNINCYNTMGDPKEAITVKDVAGTLTAFFDAREKGRSFVSAFKLWKSDSGIQRMAKTLDEARQKGDKLEKNSMLKRRGKELLAFVMGVALGVSAVAGVLETAAVETIEKIYGQKVFDEASRYTQTLSDDELAEINPALASRSPKLSTNYLTYSVVNGVKTITGTSDILQSALNKGVTLGGNRDEIVKGFAKVADYSVIDAVTGQPAYRDPIQEGTWYGVAMRIAEEAYKEGVDLNGKIAYPMKDQVIIADYGNPTAHEAFKLYLEELGAHDPEAVATAYEEAFVEKYNELSATHDQTNPGTNVEDKENFEINDELKQFVGGLVGVDSADIVSISEKFPSTNGSSNRTVFAIAGDKLYEISYNSSENTTNTTGLILEMNNAYENGKMEINGYVKYSDVLQGIRTENDWKRIYNNMAEKLGTNVYGAYIPDPETHNQLSQNADGSYNVEMLVIGDNGDMENVVVRVAKTDGKIVTLTEAYNAALTIYGADPVSGYKVYNDVTTSTLENTCPEAFQDANLAQQNPNKVVAYKMSYYDPYDDMDKVGVYLKHENNKADNNQNSVNKTNPERTK